MGANLTQPNYDLRLTGGQSATHNAFTVPDWGALRFDVHAPLLSGGILSVTLEATDGSGVQASTLVNLQAAIGTSGEYVNDTYRIGYGTSGFETFTLDIPDNLRGKSATLRFALNSGEVYLDNVFFKSQHLLLGNPTQARNPDSASPYAQNYLLEKPQYAVSYNNQTKTPNWVSWVLNKSWIDTDPSSLPEGSSEGLRDSLALTNLPTNYPPDTDYYARSGEDPWISDPALSNTVFNRKVEGADFNNAINNGSIQRGHLTAFRDRDRNAKDALATFLTTNMIPQNRDNNINNTAWAKFENYLERTLVKEENKEVYLIAGGYYSDPSDPDLLLNRAVFDNGAFIQDANGRFLTPKPSELINLQQNNQISQTATLQARYNSKNIAIPDFTWKIAVVLQPGQNISDVTANTQAIAIITPNSTKTSNSGNIQLPNQLLPRTITNWDAWPQWRVSINYLEQITGYNFLSNLPDDIEEAIESDDSSTLITPLYSAPLLAVPETTFSTSDSPLPSRIVTSINSSIWQDGFVGVPSSRKVAVKNSTLEIGPNQGSLKNSTFFEISSSEIGAVQRSQVEISPFQIGSFESSTIQNRTTEFGLSQNSTFQIYIPEIDPPQFSSTQINTSQISTNQLLVDGFNFNPTEITLPSGITLQQLLSSHNPNLQNTTVPTWTEFLQSPTPFNLKIEIQDLPTGQLAEATITGYDSNGRPNSGTLTLDTDGNSLGWFIDTTPEDNTEFDQTITTTAFRATTGTASGKYDLLTTILHELGHLQGIISGNTAFDTHVQNINGIPTFIDGTTTATLTPDRSHLDSTLYPYDLMNTSLKPGVRKLPSVLDLAILNTIWSNKPITSQQINTTANLTAGALIGITNGDFTTSTTWNTAGATNIINGTATLTEQSQKLSELTQAFIIPTGAKTLQFTIKDNHLVTGDTTKTANDAFEVALLDTNTFNPLAGTSIGLNHTDSLLNIQANGTIHKSDKVTITALTNNSSIVTIDLTQVTPSTQATLYFNLLGFGARTSTVTIDDVKLFTDTQPIPVTKNDILTTNQNTPLTLDLTQLTTNDTNVTQIQIINQPTHGTLTQTPDGKFTYQPVSTYVGNDSFTYLGFGSDGQVSNLATVNITVTGVPTTIDSISIPTNIKEGQPIQLSATTTTAANNTLTYNWYINNATTPIVGKTINYQFADNGIYPVKLNVIDNSGTVTTQSVNVTVNNVAPTISSLSKPATIKEGESVAFTATATDPGILDTLTYSWNFGDTTAPVIGQNVNHIFADNGNYNVTLTVTDKDGAATTQTVVAKVDNVAPTIVNIVKPATINEGQSVAFSATATDPGVLDTLTYSWNFGDTTPAVTGQTATHTFADNSNYNVVLTVTDKDGGVTTQTVVAKVDNVAPTIASITLPPNVIAGTAAAFTATATDVGTRDTLTYSWNFGDNTTATTGQNSTHIYTTAGTYSIILTVTDKDGAITTQTQTLTVAAPPTTGGIRASGNITINGSADFDGNTTNRTDDTQIYAGKGISLNGNITLPVKRDAAGNPLKVNGKIVLVDNEITLGTGATTATNPNQYTNFTTADRAINIPAYADIKLQEFTPLATAVVKTFNVQTTPINTSADWNTKFPAAGTATNPTVVRIINGDLNLPANINLSNYILIVENGNINFSQGNPVLNNVKLIANAGNINLNSTTGTNLSLSASGNINITGNTSLGGTSIINSNGNITTNGGLSMVNSTATVKMIAQGDLSVNGNTSLKGQLFTKKNITINGQTTIVGSIDALLNVTIGGNTTIVAK